MSNIEEDIKEYKINLTQEQSIELLKNALNKIEIRGEELYLLKIAIENILAERKQDKEKIKELEVLEDDLKDKRIVYVDTPEFEEYMRQFIPKQKIIDKIAEIKKDKENKYFDTFLVSRDINYAIEIVEEILEDK